LICSKIAKNLQFATELVAGKGDLRLILAHDDPPAVV